MLGKRLRRPSWVRDFAGRRKIEVRAEEGYKMFNAASIDTENRARRQWIRIRREKESRGRGERKEEEGKAERWEKSTAEPAAGWEQIRESRPERGRVREERPRLCSFHCRNVVDGYQGWKKEQWGRHGEQSDRIPLPLLHLLGITLCRR